MLTREIRIPNIGDFSGVPVTEILVQPGDRVEVDQSLLVLESDKATVDVPSPDAGIVAELVAKVGDPVSEGSLILLLNIDEPTDADVQVTPAVAPPTVAAPPLEPVPIAIAHVLPPAPSEARRGAPNHAGPAVRRLARELGADLDNVVGSGSHGRVLKGDVTSYIAHQLATANKVPSAAARWSGVDFAAFGPVEHRPLSRIQKHSGASVQLSWNSIPHVTSHDEADVTELEAFRVGLNESARNGGPRITLLAFVVKAVVEALRVFPDFNSSLDGDSLVLKRYYNVGFAADTPNGLVVPVIKSADIKGIRTIAGELSELAAKARSGLLTPGEMQGGTFTISSLGGLGGTGFTPIIHSPEVAIIGVSRAAHRPSWNGAEFVPRLMLPLSLSWDHRVIDGAAAARFNAHVCTTLADVRRLLL
ncbi:MAG: 2-oxo acid dehydrogenase subunit E2 [Candidatus Dormibacteraceae bacterium]